MDTQIPQEDEDNNNGSASDKSPSIPSTSINTHTKSSTGSAELQCIIGHEIGEFQKSLNSEISTFIIKKDQEVKQYTVVLISSLYFAFSYSLTLVRN